MGAHRGRKAARGVLVAAVLVAVASLATLGACALDKGGLGESPDGGAGGDGSTDVTASAEGGGGGDGSPGDDAWASGDGGAQADSGGHADGAPPESGAAADAPNPWSTDGPAPSDGGCPGVTPLLCGATGACVADCSSCAGRPIACFACDTNRQNPIGTCQPADPQSYCLNTDYTGAYGGASGEHCACRVAADCPGADQVCISFQGTATFACFTCGEAYTQAFDCKNGGKCNAQQATCN